MSRPRAPRTPRDPQRHRARRHGCRAHCAPTSRSSDGRIDADRRGRARPGRSSTPPAGYVAPGFIDIHSHSDYTLLVDPRAVSAIHQGVTLEVDRQLRTRLLPDPRREPRGARDLRPLRRGPRHLVDRSRLLRAARRGPPRGQRAQPRAQRPAPARRRRSRRPSGVGPTSWGRCSGCSRRRSSRAPGATRAGSSTRRRRGATEAELQHLARASARRGGFYATHTRQPRRGGARGGGGGRPGGAGNRDAAPGVAPDPAQRARRRRRAASRSSTPPPPQGLDVAFDMHTRLYGTTFLHTVLPPSVLAQPPDRQRELLRDPATRDAVRGYESILSAGRDWTRIVLLDNRSGPSRHGGPRLDRGTTAGRTPIDAICDLLAAALPDTAQLMVINHCHTEAQQREAFSHPLAMPGSDATTLAPDGPLAGSVFHGAYTWAAWFYRFTVRSERLLSPAEAVRRLTGLPAERLGLTDRGVLRAGRRGRPRRLRRRGDHGARHDLRAEPGRDRRRPRRRQRRRDAARRGSSPATVPARCCGAGERGAVTEGLDRFLAETLAAARPDVVEHGAGRRLRGEPRPRRWWRGGSGCCSARTTTSGSRPTRASSRLRATASRALRRGEPRRAFARRRHRAPPRARARARGVQGHRGRAALRLRVRLQRRRDRRAGGRRAT